MSLQMLSQYETVSSSHSFAAAGKIDRLRAASTNVFCTVSSSVKYFICDGPVWYMLTVITIKSAQKESPHLPKGLNVSHVLH